ncbi:hypothetical protein [Caballeronia sp. J97]|uniref:hypothetical protein n=1 Tax=Caballeronia sp. J97 TaxID=2805429 RepID=UPI002AB24F83|nr:hypothetical protein [Caballeronia sp. J97]
MKKLAAALLAATVTVPMLSYAQSPTPADAATQDGSSQHADARHSDSVYDREYGASTDGTVQGGWTTQPSPQALGQSLYNHR